LHLKKFRRFIEKAVEGTLLVNSLITSIAVLFIIFFLFKEGIGLFGNTVVEPHHIIVINKNNPINSLTAKQVKDIFDQHITSWQAVGGKNDSIAILTIDEITNYCTEEELGGEFEYLPHKIDSIVDANAGIIAYFSDNYIDEHFTGKKLPEAKISLSDFLLGREWYPTSQPAAQFGVLPLILGTLLVSFFAILFALPIGLITAIYMAEVAGERFRNILKPTIELLAGIPSVVYGFFGLVVLVPAIQKIFNLPVGETALAGSIILAIMALPTIITISEDAIRTTPGTLREASLALGATRWQTLVRVVVPYAKSGITAAIILGVGRAVGETMAVLMVTGNATVMPPSLTQPTRTIPATIAAELGEAPFGGVHFKALFALGIILFLMTLVFNLLVDYTKSRMRK
jgi:phosphate transport system permease protein